MADIDPRRMRVIIELEDRTVSYDELAITLQGTAYTNENQGEATITIANVDIQTRDFVLTQGSPFLRDRQQANKRITIEAGRVSTGLSTIYSGNIYRATVSNPPDQILSIRCLQQQAQKGVIVSNNFAGQVQLSTIAQRVADDIGVILVFEATDKQISDYSFTGGATDQVRKLEEAGGIDAWIDNGTLYIKNQRAALSNRIITLTPDNGMVGIPQTTEQGIRVMMMYNNQMQAGGQIDLQSRRYPHLSGRYVVYRLGYNLANRDTPFYLIAEANRLP